MFNGNGLDGVKGVMFDCYKTLIDIKTDERDLKTYDPVSRWLMYHGVNISPQDLMNEYHRRCREELERRGEWHSELKVEDVFRKICRQHASWPIDDITIGIEAARLFRSASVRRLRPFPQSVRLLKKLKGYPLGIVSNGQRIFSELELRQLDLHSYFNFVIFSSDFGYKKPDSRIFLAGAGNLGLQPHEILCTGDSWDNDINPSRGIGMKAMHIEEAWRLFKVA